MSIHVSQFYACNSVSLAVEMQYIVELGKYLREKGECLSVDGIVFEKVLRKSRFWDYFRMAVDEGWVVDCNCADIAINSQFPIDYNARVQNVLIAEEEVNFNSTEHNNRKKNIDYNYRTPVKKCVKFSEKTDKYWSWNLSDYYMVNNSTLNSAGGEDCWVSLLAYIAVKRLMLGKPQVFLVTINYELAYTHMVLSSFILLNEETSACSGWCFFNFDESVSPQRINHLGYSAWYAKGVEQGYLRRYYTSREKYEYARNMGIQVGDIVYLYERKVGQKLNFLKEISGFHFAKVLAYGKDCISLYIFNTKKTKYQGKVDYANYNMTTKAMYNFTNPYESVNATEKTYDWTDMGVEYCMYGEQFFITECSRDDGKVMAVQYGDWTPLRLRLNSVELIYWILKDYGIEFNEERFLSKYFMDKPLYQQYIETGTVPGEYIVR